VVAVVRQETVTPRGALDAGPSLTAVAGAATPATAGRLELSSPTAARSFTVEDLAGMPKVEGYGGFTCPPHPRVSGPTHYAGVALRELLDAVGGIEAGSVVSVAASDGYVMTFSAEQVLLGGFTVYDPQTGAKSALVGHPRPVVAYEREGEPLSAEEGPFRLVFLTDGPEQLVEGFLWINRVTRIQVRSRDDDWTLWLAGVTQTSLDRVSFEELDVTPQTCAAWEDIQGRTWAGVPLTMLIGLVDGGDASGGFDQEQALRGYDIEVVGNDGTAVTLNSAVVAEAGDLVVANTLEGNPLGDIDFPLRLVGPGLASSQMVSGVKEIRVSVP